MSSLAPLKCKHLVWSCFIDGPLTEFPLKISSLIDNGCHLILIRPDIVKKLGLHISTLKQPETVDVAIKNRKEKLKIELNQYVILKATSRDQKWISKGVRALIAPDLCMPVIFGLPFLTHNNIVTDHALRSCIDKKCGYDLINPDPVLPPLPKLSPKAKRKRARQNCVDHLAQLKVCLCRAS